MFEEGQSEMIVGVRRDIWMTVDSCRAFFSKGGLEGWKKDQDQDGSVGYVHRCG